MGAFTIPLKKVLDIQQDPGTGVLIGLGQYPIFDEKHRLELNRRIIAHYWNIEIAHESISLFVFAMARKMNEIMPLYNQVYESTLLEFDPISNYKLTTERKDTTTETGTQHSTASSDATSKTGSRAVGSDTPQTMLRGDGDYASTAQDNTVQGTTDSSSTTDGDSSANSELDGTSTTTGYQGSPSDMLLKYRATLLNTDMLIVEDLSECFMGLWDNEPDLFIPQLGRGYYRLDY